MGYLDRIKFSNKVTTYCVREYKDHHIRYNMVTLKTGEFNILTDISDHVTLIKTIDTAGNVNHTVSIIGCWIYNPNLQK